MTSVPPENRRVPLEQLINQEREAFLLGLRNESGEMDPNNCPVCGSGAWEIDNPNPTHGYCDDCGFDLISEFSHAPQIVPATEGDSNGG